MPVRLVGVGKVVPVGRSGVGGCGYAKGTVSALGRQGPRAPGVRGVQLCVRKAAALLTRPALYHLLLLPDGSWDTVECLAAMIRRRATVPP